MSPLFSFLYGPTASGKTATALAWAERTHGNLVSTDARQIYQDMNIVVGKDIPAGSTWEAVPGLENAEVSAWHLPNGTWLFGTDLVPPTRVFTISHWYRWVQPIIEWHRHTQIPLLFVGGTWPWFEVLIAPPASLFIPPDSAWRQTAQTLSLPELQMLAQKTSPDRWQALSLSDQNNTRRLIRLIEVRQSPITSKPTPLIQAEEWQLFLRQAEMDDLTASIQERVLARWNNGALEETENLLQKYPSWNTPAFTASGYPILRQHLEGKLTLDAALQEWTYAERQYAKRQRTWLKKIAGIYPFAII